VLPVKKIARQLLWGLLEGVLVEVKK